MKKSIKNEMTTSQNIALGGGLFKYYWVNEPLGRIITNVFGIKKDGKYKKKIGKEKYIVEKRGQLVKVRRRIKNE